MRVETDIKLFLRSPSVAGWTALRAAAARWNSAQALPIDEVGGFMLHVALPAVSGAEIRDFKVWLAETRRQVPLDAIGATRRLYDAQDWLDAPFVQIFGRALDGLLVPNVEEALAPPLPCPECALQTIFDAVQRAPYAIDESLLDAGVAAEPRDLVALPAGRLLVSARGLAVLQGVGARGLETRPVTNAATGLPSTWGSQVVARCAVLASADGADATCGTCGAARDDPDAPDLSFEPSPEFRLDGSRLAGDEVVARHPSRATMLYFSQRAWRAMRDAGLDGIEPSDLMRLTS